MAKIETRNYIPIAEAAKRLDLSADTLRQYVHNEKRGRTPCIKGFQMAPGLMWMFHRDDLARFEKERRDRGRPKSDD